MTIFISIASYCDPLLGFTMERAWRQARWPEQLRFGVVEQSPVDSAPLDTGSIPREQINHVFLDARQARGPCWARAIAMTLYRGESWFLQLDSHMEFEPDWDAALLGQAQAIAQKQPRFVISCYPAPFLFVDGQPVRQDTTRNVLAHVVKPGVGFSPEHPVLMFEAHPVEQEEPVRGFHLGAGCLFGPGELVQRFPYDPFLYFHGEEQAFAARLFTHGWDIFHIAGMPISHLYYDPASSKRVLHWDQALDTQRTEKWWELERRSRERLGHLLCEGRDLGIYGLGHERSLDDYARFCGIDYRGREIAPVAYEGPWRQVPRLVLEPQMPEPLRVVHAPAVPAREAHAAPGYDPGESRTLDASWTEWLRSNLDRGCDPEELLGILLKERFALAPVRKLMGPKFPADSRLLDAAVRETPAPPDYLAISQPPLVRRADGHKVRRVDTDRLQIYTIDDFLSVGECDALVGLIGQHLRPSTVTIEGTDRNFRTSRTSDLSLLDSAVVAAIDEKISRTLGIHQAYAEGNQAQRYDVGQEFKAHTDFFEPGTDEFATFGGRFGNRTWTFMVYLNDGMEGGGTRFLAIDHIFQPKKGQAVVWNNLHPDGSPNRDTLHAGTPVTRGHKIIITKWFRARGDGPMFRDD
ncbi:MAG TPA: GlcNAc-transferase family protein [Ramlibacter sp.]|nr:GlcNAc-transferase family protein [Ramlibacter sp.]